MMKNARSRYCSGLWLVTGGLIVSAHGVIQAEQVAPAPASDDSAETISVGELEQIVVTARRHSETLQEAPVSITAISGAKLEQLGFTTPEQLSRLAPSVNIVTNGGVNSGAAIFIRGIGQSDIGSANDAPVAVYIDGVYRARMATNNFDSADLERVEVLRGPQGTLYGRNSTAGAINFISRKPTEEFGLEQKISYASDREVIARTILNSGRVTPRGPRVKLTYFHHSMDGYVDNPLADGPHDPGATSMHTGTLTLAGEIGNAFSYELSGDVGRQKYQPVAYQLTAMAPDPMRYFGASPSLGGAALMVSPDWTDTVVTHDPYPRNELELGGVAATLRYAATDALEVKLVTAYRDYAITQHHLAMGDGPLLGRVLDPVTRMVTIKPVTPYAALDGGYERQHQLTNELQINGEWPRLKYVGGIFHIEEEWSKKLNAHITAVLPGGNLGVDVFSTNASAADNSSIAGYAQISWTPPVAADRLEVTTGVRYTADERALTLRNFVNGVEGSPGAVPRPVISQSQDFSNTSGELTLRYRWAPEVMSYLRAANAYKAGGFNSLGAQAGGAFFPEEAFLLEGGVKSEWFARRLQLNASIYRLKYDDLQVPQFRSTGAGFASITTNAGEATYVGGEIELAVALGGGWTLEGSAGVVDPRWDEFLFVDPASGQTIDLKDEARFPYLSKHTYHIGSQYDRSVKIGTITARADYNHISGRCFFLLDRLNPFSRDVCAGAQRELGARLSLSDVRFKGLDLQLSLYGENLLDEHYRLTGVDFGALGFGNNVYARSRRFGVELIARY